MDEIQAAIKKIEEDSPEILKALIACKNAVHVAAKANPDIAILKNLHHRLWEAEVAVLQSCDLVSTLS